MAYADRLQENAMLTGVDTGPGGPPEGSEEGGAGGWWGQRRGTKAIRAISVTDETGRADRGTRQTYKRGQEQD